MKVALVIFGALDARSGGFRYDLELVGALRRVDHAVEIVSQRWSSRYREQAATARAAGWIEETGAVDPDIVLIDELNHAATGAGLGALRRRLRDGVPIVAVVHHLRSDERFGRVRARLEERRFLRGCDAWLCNGNTTLRRVVQTAGTQRRNAVVPPGREEENRGGSPDAERRHPPEVSLLGGDGAPLRVLAVGSIEPRKNFHTLVRAIASVPTAHLAIVGSREVDRAYTRRLERQIARLGVGERVRLNGWLDTADLGLLYAKSDVFALTSYYEGFGIVYLEAMAHGLPVIATRRGGARDLVRDRVDGYLVDPRAPGAIAARVLELAGDAELRRELGAAAQKRALALPTWDRAMRNAVRFLVAVAERTTEEGVR